MLRFQHRMRPRKLKVYPTGGPEARLKKLRQIVTGLIRYERIEPSWAHADEARQYAERLIYLAIKNGDKHKPTMEAADYWITEKDLIPKLFQVLVPRFQNSQASYTNLYKQAVEYPGRGFPLGVLELKGNPWPPVLPRPRDTRNVLSNVLLSAAKQDFYTQKQLDQQSKGEQHLKSSPQSPEILQSLDVHSSSSFSSSSSPSSSSSSSSFGTSSSSSHPPSSSVDPPEFSKDGNR